MLLLFKNIDNDFSDILTDVNVKPRIKTKMQFDQHLFLNLNFEDDNQFYSYILLKFGESLIKITEKDYTPIPKIDYYPRKIVKNENS